MLSRQRNNTAGFPTRKALFMKRDWLTVKLVQQKNIPKASDLTNIVCAPCFSQAKPTAEQQARLPEQDCIAGDACFDQGNDAEKTTIHLAVPFQDSRHASGTGCCFSEVRVLCWPGQQSAFLVLTQPHSANPFTQKSRVRLLQ